MIARLILFFSSYSPLFFMLALRFDPLWLRLTCFVLGVFGVIGLIFFINVNKKARTSEPRKVETVSNAGAAASAYLAGYLLPFLAMETPTVSDLLALLLFFIVAYNVNAKTGLLQVNPLIFLCPGRSIQRITFPTGKDYLVIAHGRVGVGDNIQLRRMGSEDVYIMPRT